ncbi:hypothetical protein M9H77_28066 [Catharanthus roseus]|uniref:Uncharacterized protein n=1 Tax=Catharanthus roseus TaxID=4058 RepID=A0ACC0AIK5_CATRO|nr:hypothetical protein M9H77_28066 [Catharanthus roseus]
MGIKGEENFQKDYSLCDVYLFTHCKYSEEGISKVLEKDKRILFGEDVELGVQLLNLLTSAQRKHIENPLKSRTIFSIKNWVGNKVRDIRRKWIIEIHSLPQDVADATCWDIIGNILITSVQAMHKFVFLKVFQ